MKKFLIGMLGIVVLAVVAALVAPSFIDWNAYRAEIATEVRKATGRRLVIEGPIDVALLPTPKLSAAKVRLANLEGAATPDMVRLESLDVRVAFWPLLSGKVVVNSIELKGAEIELEALADGRVNWEFGPARKAGAPDGGTGGLDGSAGDGDAVRLEQVVISDGSVTWRDSRKGTVERIENIDARLAAETLSGPFVVRGRATARGVPLDVFARAGRIDAGRATPANAEIELRDAGTKVVVAGTFTTGDVAAVNLRADMRGDDLGRTVAAFTGGGEGPAILGQKFSLTATVIGDARSITVNDITFNYNGTRATGALTASLGAVPVIDTAIGINTLDLDAWLAAAKAARAKAAPAKAEPQAQPGAGAAPGKAAGFSFPKDMRLSVDARIGGITYNKGAVREVVLQGKLDGGAFQLTRISAQLPGGSEAQLTGRVTARDGAPRFDGRVEARIADARQFLDWLGVDHSAVAPDRLHRISLTSGLGYGQERLEASDIDLRFDTTRIGGGLIVALRERIGIGANLTLDRINLDAYLADSKNGAAAAGAAGAKGDTQGSGQDGLAALGTFDANLRAQARSVTFHGVTLEGIALDSSLIGGDLTVKHLRVANLAGGTLDLSGKVAGLDREPVPDFRFALATKRPEQLFALAGLAPPAAPAKLAPFLLEGAFKADDKATELKADLAAGALRLAVAGRLSGLATAPRLGLDLKAEHPSFLEFVRLFDPAFTPKATPKGPFSLAARADGAGFDLKLADIKAQLGEATVTGTAAVALAGARPRITAALEGGTIVADHFLPASLGGGNSDTGPARAGIPGPGSGGPSSGPPWSDAPLDLDSLRAFDAELRMNAKSLLWQSWQVDDPDIEMVLKDGRLDLRHVTGKTVGGTFKLSGLLAAPAKKGGPAELRADLDIARADLHKAMFNLAALDIASGTVTFRTSFAGKGVSSRALVGALGGDGRLEVKEGAISGFDLGAVNEKLKNLNEPASFLGLLQTAMSGGTTKFSALMGTFKIADGVVRSEDIALNAEGGAGTATLVADLPRWQIDSTATFRLSGHKDAPPFRMQLQGALDSPRRIFNLNELQAWLVRRVAGGLVQDLLKKDKGASPPQAPKAQPPAAKPQQPSADEFIRGIIDLLGDGKKK